MLFNKLTELGFDVKIYTSTPKFKFKDEHIKSAVVFIPMFFQIIKKISSMNLWPWMKYFDQYLFDKITSIIMRDADIVYGFAFCSLSCGKKIKKKGGIYLLDRACPHVEFQNNILVEESKKSGLYFHKSGKFTLKRGVDEYRCADKIVTPSSYTKKSFLDKGFDDPKICIAPLIGKNKVSKFSKTKINKLDSVTFAFVGENLLRKGFMYVLEGWKMLGNNHNHKLIIRSNNSNIYSNKLIADLLNQKGVLIKDYYKDINDFYNEVDILCLPSIDEGFGMVVLEAMSNGIPAIISTNVGSSDLVSDKRDGLIISPKSSDEVYKAMNFFIENKEEIYNYGKQAYDSVQDVLESDKYKQALSKII